MCGALPAAGSYLRVNRLQGGQAVKKNRELLQGPSPTYWDSRASAPAATWRFGNIDPIPFRCTARIASLTQDFSISQDRLTLVHFSLRSSHLNVRYYHQDLYRGPYHSGSCPQVVHDPYALLLVGALHSACPAPPRLTCLGELPPRPAHVSQTYRSRPAPSTFSV